MSVTTDTQTDEDALTTTDGDGGDDPGDSDPYKKMYVAVDGIMPEDLDDSDIGLIEDRLATLLLVEIDAPISDVRVIRDNEGVVEFECER